MKLADKEISAQLTDDNGYGLLILESNIAVMDLGNGYEGAVKVDCDNLENAFEIWLGDSCVKDHASNETIQLVAFRLGHDVNFDALANRLGYDNIAWNWEHDCYYGSGSSDPYDRSKDGEKFHVASSVKQLITLWRRS